MKKGFIKVSNILYQKDWNIISMIFKDFRVSHVEFRHWENDIWYFYGDSGLFDEVKEGEMIPQYDVVFTSHPDQPLTYKFEKC